MKRKLWLLYCRFWAVLGFPDILTGETYYALGRGGINIWEIRGRQLRGEPFDIASIDKVLTTAVVTNGIERIKIKNDLARAGLL